MSRCAAPPPAMFADLNSSTRRIAGGDDAGRGPVLHATAIASAPNVTRVRRFMVGVTISTSLFHVAQAFQSAQLFRRHVLGGLGVRLQASGLRHLAPTVERLGEPLYDIGVFRRHVVLVERIAFSVEQLVFRTSRRPNGMPDQLPFTVIDRD